MIYLQKWKQLLRFELLYNIKVIEDTVRHDEEINNIFSSSFVFVIMVQTEFSPANCPLPALITAPPPLPPLNWPCQMSSYESKNHIRNIKCFLLKKNLDSCSNLCNIQQPNFPKSRTMWCVVCLAPCTGCRK